MIVPRIDKLGECRNCLDIFICKHGIALLSLDEWAIHHLVQYFAPLCHKRGMHVDFFLFLAHHEFEGLERDNPMRQVQFLLLATVIEELEKGLQCGSTYSSYGEAFILLVLLMAFISFVMPIAFTARKQMKCFAKRSAQSA